MRDVLQYYRAAFAGNSLIHCLVVRILKARCYMSLCSGSKIQEHEVGFLFNA